MPAFNRELQTRPTSAESPAVLRELVQRYQVCWEVWPEYVFVGREKRQIGFVLELSGTHAPGVEHPTPGCDHCKQVFTALKALAVQVEPVDPGDAAYSIEPFDQALHYSQANPNRPEVTLAIRILHQSDYERPVDASEVRCLAQTKQRLVELGTCEGHWTPHKEMQQ